MIETQPQPPSLPDPKKISSDPPMRKTATDQNAPETIEAIQGLLAWLEGRNSAGELSLSAVKASPNAGVRPSVTLLRGGQAVLTVSA